jgi:ribosomal protein L3 glutamine methyltransferase
LVYGHGTDNAIDDAAALVFHVLDRGTRMPRTNTRSVRTRRGAACPRRVRRAHRSTIPVAYLMGRMWFAGLEFMVDHA